MRKGVTQQIANTQLARRLFQYKDYISPFRNLHHQFVIRTHGRFISIIGIVIHRIAAILFTEAISSFRNLHYGFVIRSHGHFIFLKGIIIPRIDVILSLKLSIVIRLGWQGITRLGFICILLTPSRFVLFRFVALGDEGDRCYTCMYGARRGGDTAGVESCVSPRETDVQIMDCHGECYVSAMKMIKIDKNICKNLQGFVCINYPFQRPIRTYFVINYRRVSGWNQECSHRYESWEAHQQHCCQHACHISEQWYGLHPLSFGFLFIEFWCEVFLRQRESTR